MYFDIIKRIVNESIKDSSSQNGDDRFAVIEKMRRHLDHTRQQYRQDAPEIHYAERLCRLAYLYSYGAAGATMFEKVLLRSDDLVQKLKQAVGRDLALCAIGGGPGTELLGIGKYLMQGPGLMPGRLDFTVLDAVLEWKGTWDKIWREVDSRLRSSLVDSSISPPGLSTAFLSLDVVEPASYAELGDTFLAADIVVFNHVFSENKPRLQQAQLSIDKLREFVPAGCMFVVIDRLEQVTDFKNQVVQMFRSIFRSEINVRTLGGALDRDEDKDVLGKDLLDSLGSPRTSFYAGPQREPSVFWFVTQKG